MATRTTSSKSATGRRKRSTQGQNGASRASRTGEQAGSDDAESMDPARDAEALEKLRASDKRYYRIGEVSRLTGVKAHVLRYWETEFRWMAPPKSRSKQRLYRKRDIELVWLLKRLLWGERYTIAGARQRIQELGVEKALGLLDQPMGAASMGPAPSEASRGREDWATLRAALDAMRSDLLGLRAALQEGL
jgi:DNA-binding transcriptional MerR regulator